MVKQNGNILSKTEYAGTEGAVGEPTNVQKYTYMKTGWNDLLHTYNNRIVTHDDLGNPLRYRDNLRFTWVGRLMATAKTSATATSSYSYAQSGLRLKKEYQDGTEVVTHTYDYDGTLLVREKYGDTTLWFMYDESGSPVGLRRYVNGAYYIYYYVKNAQGDIVGITNSAGQVAVKYTYDSWGKVLSVTTNTGTAISPTDTNHIANINPLRYRGYYYDTETGLYYLQSRYYDPVTGRFVNTDGLIVGGSGLFATNMFAYCGNSPIMHYDPTGYCFFGSNGKWMHDNWEYIGGYVRKPAPAVLEIQELSDGLAFIVAEGTEAFGVPRGSVIIYDKRDETTPSNNNFEVNESHNIKDKPKQKEVCEVIIDYNNRNPENYNWDRNLPSMLSEWGWHNFFYSYGVYQDSSRSVNFDMGLLSNSMNPISQMEGYFFEKIKRMCG